MFCDIHNHVLPGVDDGAQTLDDSLRMIEQAVHAGISHICATPHLTAYSSEGSVQQHHIAVHHLLREELHKRGIPIELSVGCELYYTSEFPQVANMPLFSYQQSSRCVLVELPPTEAPPWFADVCFDIMMKGISVLLAHPERNMALMRNPFTLAKYVRMGILTQVTAGSLAGKYGQDIRDFAMRIVQANACAVVACDAHDTFRRPFSDITPAYDELCTTVGTGIANTLCSSNPMALLHGEELRILPFGEEQEQILLKPKKKKRFLFF